MFKLHKYPCLVNCDWTLPRQPSSTSQRQLVSTLCVWPGRAITRCRHWAACLVCLVCLRAAAKGSSCPLPDLAPPSPKAVSILDAGFPARARPLPLSRNRPSLQEPSGRVRYEWTGIPHPWSGPRADRLFLHHIFQSPPIHTSSRSCTVITVMIHIMVQLGTTFPCPAQA